MTDVSRAVRVGIPVSPPGCTLSTFRNHLAHISGPTPEMMQAYQDNFALSVDDATQKVRTAGGAFPVDWWGKVGTFSVDGTTRLSVGALSVGDSGPELGLRTSSVRRVSIPVGALIRHRAPSVPDRRTAGSRSTWPPMPPTGRG